ncbi:MAG TPA: hypothetical protein VK864_08345 [Longimicrobiales bacterium]|nr:hypothetical protein [Longimicrobiales bacterium]
MTRKISAVIAATLLLSACSENGGPVGPNNPGTPVELSVVGKGDVLERFTSEVAASGTWVYTGTWSVRAEPGNAVKIWNASASTPTLVDSLIIPDSHTVGDVQVSDDGTLLVVASEFSGALSIFDRSNPAKPVLLSRLTNDEIEQGVHTVKLGRVDGRHYAFLSIDPSPARLVIVDITDPSNPVQVWSQQMGAPFVHDVFVRDGLLFTALWDDGMTIWDLGGLGGGSPSAPAMLGNVRTVGGDVHNIYWFHDPVSGSKRYAFIGEEGRGVVGRPLGTSGSTSGDIHVVDVSNPAAPAEVAFFHVDSAGVHNFAVDEANGILYAAYYNAGVRALDIRGDLGTCEPAEKAPDGRCDLGLMKRERARALTDRTVSIWGVALSADALYASDMLSGVWRLEKVPPR